DAAGGAADEAMALDLVRGFGAPEDVADQYRAPGFTIIPPTRSARFALLAFAGVALQWLITLPPVLPLIFAPGREFVAVGHWWLTAGLGALWWPGFLVSAAIIAAWVRHTWPAAERTAWRPRTQDTDRINRPLWAIGIVAAACGVAAMFSAPALIVQTLPQ